MFKLVSTLCLILLPFFSSPVSATNSPTNLNNSPIVIAHRGASGHLPEHTLASKALAYGMGADYIEQDVVMTKDNVLIVFHDLVLGHMTNVQDVYPSRKRTDGKFYVIDFTFQELKALTITERKLDNTLKYPERFNVQNISFHFHTLEQELALIQSLNRTTGRNVGIYPEIKSPWFHKKHNKDISLHVLTMLKAFGYSRKGDHVFVQSFDPNELKRIKYKLQPQLDIELNLVQLVAETSWRETKEFVNGSWQNYSYDWMFGANGINEIAAYADGIGPWFPMLADSKGNATAFLRDALTHKLVIHPYTFRTENTPELFGNYESWVQHFVFHLGVHGVFSDQPEQAIKALNPTFN
ncbi:glycerophosphodiester phosphodiesterase [Thalassotalea euphylliae]|uniref:glycerophosphodiester phosphodiesterase n=1 Tax=Thalassotalea euphylliae TaxID=1655234 RepID=UPI00363FEC0E